MKPAPASPLHPFHTLKTAADMLSAGRAALAWTEPLAAATRAWAPPPVLTAALPPALLLTGDKSPPSPA